MRQLGGILAIVGALLASGADAAAPLPRPACPPGQAPRFVQFAALKEQLGTAMGTPLECEHASPEIGDLFQQTTTGFAFYDMKSATPTFTDGDRHWALTSSGLTHWTGGWHAGLLPPASVGSPGDPSETAAPPSTYPRLIAAKLLRQLDPAGNSLVVDYDGNVYQLEADTGCLSAVPADGQTVFILSPGSLTEAGSLLITALRGRECPILASRELR